jgi:hypothetical protein
MLCVGVLRCLNVKQKQAEHNKHVGLIRIWTDKNLYFRQKANCLFETCFRRTILKLL